MIYANMTSMYPTYFLQGVQLIVQSREHFKVPSENWPNPTQNRLGNATDDRYYCEVWSDGMDWQVSYWALEEKNLNKPIALPFIIFKDNENREKFKSYDFDNLIKAALSYRRDKFWIQNDSYKCPYTDLVWPFLFLENEEVKHRQMMLYSFGHNSQPTVEFYMNVNFIPEEYRQKKRSNRGVCISNLPTLIVDQYLS